jgi:hypothetical protein
MKVADQQPTPPAPGSGSTSAAVEHGSAPVVGSYNFRLAAIVGFIVGVVDILVAGRFLGKLLGASSQSAFVDFIYHVTAPLVVPFAGIFGDTGSKANLFETASVVAVVVYAVIGWGVVAGIKIATAPRGTKPAS